MANIIVVFPKIEDARSIRNLLVRNGFKVVGACTTGAQVLNYAEELGDGIVVCGYRFADMIYSTLHEYLPPYFEMVLIASQRYQTEKRADGVVFVPMPLKLHDLTEKLNEISEAQFRRRRKLREQPKKRSEEERGLIEKAKELLMEQNHMTETEAHRYIQKCSMDSGTNMAETAQMVISIMAR